MLEEGGWDSTEPSKTSGGSTFSGLRCLVIGISSETWTKLTREVRYAMLRDMIVRSWRCSGDDPCISFFELDMSGRTKKLAFWISSWSWVMRSMLDSSSSIAV